GTGDSAGRAGHRGQGLQGQGAEGTQAKAQGDSAGRAGHRGQGLQGQGAEGTQAKAQAQGQAETQAQAQGHKGRASLSPEQLSAFYRALHGKQNLFLTGAAGTGKSHLLAEIVHALKKKLRQGGHDGDLREAHWTPCAVFVTGVAASHIGGTTLHSFAGIGLGKEPVPELLRKIRGSKGAVKRWQQALYLVVDEVNHS
ncbi:hypothetical protein B484DRAFT_409999, partial [Ochromonadaceae sp. CCMP2298]